MGNEARGTAKLPESSAIPVMEMLLHDGRDQVAAALDQQGWQGFERPLPEYLFACAQAWPGLFIDVGANTGFYSLLAACADVRNEIVAFEPDEDIIKLLVANIALNHLGARIHLSPIALSDRSGVGALYVPTKEHGLIETSSSLEAEFKMAHSETREIQMDRLDNLLAAPRWAEAAPQVMKIDVEGHEAAVLRGALKTLEIHRPVVFIELLDRGDFGFVSEFLETHRYKDFQLQPDGAVETVGPVGFNPQAWNHALIPHEKTEKFRSCVRLMA